MSRRRTLVPTHRCAEAGFGFAVAVAARPRSASPARSQYVIRPPPAAATVPSLTLRSAAGTPSFAAAADRRISRASAQAKRSAVPLCSTERLPAVWPSLGVRAVSPYTRSEEHTSELQSHRDLHSFPTRRSSDLARLGAGKAQRGAALLDREAAGRLALVGRARGVAVHDLDARQIHVQLVGGDLRERGADALPQLDLAREDRHGAGRIDPQPSIQSPVAVETTGQARGLREPEARGQREEIGRAHV